MWQGGILYCCNLPSLSFSLLPLNLGSEVFRRTLLVVSVLFCGCTIMDLVRITCLQILKINYFMVMASIYLILRCMVQNLLQVLPILCCSFRIWSQRSFSVSDIFRFGQTTATIWSAHGSFAFTKAHSPFLLLPFILTLLRSPGIRFTVKQLLFFYSRWLKLNLPCCYCCKFMGREEYYPKLQTDMNGKRFLWSVSYSFICAMDLWTGSIYNFNVYWSTGDAFRNVDSQWKKLFQGISEERLLATTKVVDEELTVKQLLIICAHVTITSSAVA